MSEGETPQGGPAWIADVVKAAMGGAGAHVSDANRSALSAREKIRLYLFTLFTVAFVYLAPQIFALVREIMTAVGTIPMAAWKGLWIFALVAVGGTLALGLILGGYAIREVFRTGRYAIGGGKQ